MIKSATSSSREPILFLCMDDDSFTQYFCVFIIPKFIDYVSVTSFFFFDLVTCSMHFSVLSQSKTSV